MLRKVSRKNIGTKSRVKIDWYSPIYNMHMYWTKQKPEVVAEFIERHCRPGGTVLDAFCGSGMTGVAAMLTGRNAVLSDLSPVCEFMAKNFTTVCDLNRLRKTFSEITDALDADLSWLYATSCNQCDNHEAKVHAVIWADDFSCPSCGHTQNLCDGDEQLSIKKGETVDSIKCKKCKTSYEKAMKFFSASKPVLVEVECDKCDHHGKDNCRRVNDADLKWIRRIDRHSVEGKYPKDFSFPMGINTKRCLLRGIKKPYQLFSKMNLIYLAEYWTAIDQRFAAKKIDGTVRDKLRFAATSAMFHGSLMRRWLPYRGGVPLKGTLFVPSMSEDIRFEKVLRYQANRVFKGQEAINSIEQRATTTVRCASALDLSWVKDGSIDYVFYDPPFGGHINYSELNLVWEAWLRDTTDTTDEVIVNRHQGKDLDRYTAMLKKSLEIASKKLKRGGKFTVIFAHSDLKTWRSLQESVAGLPLKILGAPVALDSANKTFIQVYSSKAQQSMIAFTFQKADTTNDKLSSDFKLAAKREISELLKRSPSGMSRDVLYDHVIQRLFDKSYFEEIDFDSLLSKNFKRSGDQWLRPSA